MRGQQAQRLLEAARSSIKFAYAPYSKFKVGAALLGEDGRIWTGCNVENASYGLTICAERVAVSKAISEGGRGFKAIAVVSNSSKPTYPCGACLQLLSEFGPGIIVLICSSKKTVWKKLPQLFPYPFNS